MSGEYLQVDRQGLILLAVLLQDFWVARSPKDRCRFAVEIRQQESRFGLTPVDRRRLQWAVQRAEVAVKKTAARRKKADPNKDPRDVLKLTYLDGPPGSVRCTGLENRDAGTRTKAHQACGSAVLGLGRHTSTA